LTRPFFSVGEYTTPSLTFAEDLEVYRAAGVDGIGIDVGLKVTDRAAALEQFRESGLRAAFCFGSTPAVLPLPLLPGTEDPGLRVEEICAGLDYLARFDPVCCILVTGPYGALEPARAERLVVEGLGRIAARAAELDLTVAIEPMHRTLGPEWSFVSTIPAAIDLLDRVGSPNLGMLFDVWHLWDSPDVRRHVVEHAARFSGVQVNDWRDPTRSWCDRVLPGEGAADVVGLLEALGEGGFEGWFELEVFSDDGTFEHDFSDSLWRWDPAELVRIGREKFLAAWELAGRPGGTRPDAGRRG